MIRPIVQPKWSGFSLVEVVLAIGVIAFAIVAILGMFPVGLQTSHSSQDETRAAQIAQDILTSIASQVLGNYPSVKIVQPSSSFSYNLNLGSSQTYSTLAADNNGSLIALTNASDAPKYPYNIVLQVSPDPPGFGVGYASIVTVHVAWQPFAKNYRDYARVFSKY
jgi:uncharacterized protein (TIGR02598 family)